MSATIRLNQALKDTEKALPADRFVIAIDLWHEMGCWGRTTIKKALLELYNAGRAEREPRPIPGGVVYAYRRKVVA